MADAEFPLETVELHGRRLAYRRLGEGPVLLLVHGITNRRRAGGRSRGGWPRRATPFSPVAHGRAAHAALTGSRQSRRCEIAFAAAP